MVGASACTNSNEPFKLIHSMISEWTSGPTSGNLYAGLLITRILDSVGPVSPYTTYTHSRGLVGLMPEIYQYIERNISKYRSHKYKSHRVLHLAESSLRG